jgi:spore photoproduct lyase
MAQGAHGGDQKQQLSNSALKFSHVYVEEQAYEYPETNEVLNKLSGARVVPISHYKDLFNRPRQHFQIQKKSPKLILAVERDRFLYEGTERIRSFGNDVVHYNALVRNCVYNCDYCFLQGMHQSGNIVMFVNNEDFMEAAQHKAREKPIYLSISYLTDLLGFEPLLPYCRRWITFAHQEPDVTVEIRTKSDNYRAIQDLTPADNVVLVWSLSPEWIARSYEKGTASFKNRLFAARQAAADGWRLRLCFDPILRTEEWEAQYEEAIEETFRRIPAESIEEISIGVFRLHPDFLARMQRMRHDSRILFDTFEKSHRLVSYEEEEIEAMRSHVAERLSRHVSPDAITFVHG